MTPAGRLVKPAHGYRPPPPETPPPRIIINGADRQQPLPLPAGPTARRKRKWEVHRLDSSARPILLFDRHHPSVPTCAQSVPPRAAAVKDGPSSGNRFSGA